MKPLHFMVEDVKIQKRSNVNMKKIYIFVKKSKVFSVNIYYNVYDKVYLLMF